MRLLNSMKNKNLVWAVTNQNNEVLSMIYTRKHNAIMCLSKYPKHSGYKVVEFQLVPTDNEWNVV